MGDDIGTAFAACSANLIGSISRDFKPTRNRGSRILTVTVHNNIDNMMLDKTSASQLRVGVKNQNKKKSRGWNSGVKSYIVLWSIHGSDPVAWTRTR